MSSDYIKDIVNAGSKTAQQAWTSTVRVATRTYENIEWLASQGTRDIGHYVVKQSEKSGLTEAFTQTMDKMFFSEAELEARRVKREAAKNNKDEGHSL